LEYQRTRAKALPLDEQKLIDQAIKEANPENDDPTIMQVPNDVLANSSSSVSDAGLSVSTAPTSKPSRPRALAIAYNPTTKVIYIVFRDNTWWQYNDVGTDIWMGLSSSSSTNDYLPTLENECSSHGPAQLINMSAAAMAQLSGLAETADRIRKS
jgi:KTSC domain